MANKYPVKSENGETIYKKIVASVKPNGGLPGMLIVLEGESEARWITDKETANIEGDTHE